MILSADTNLSLYAANQDSPNHAAARDFFATEASGQSRFLLCGLVLAEIYMQLRNPAVFKKPKTAKEAAGFCSGVLRSAPGSAPGSVPNNRHYWTIFEIPFKPLRMKNSNQPLNPDANIGGSGWRS